VVDGSGLENRHTRKGIGGSNPSLSATVSNTYRQHLLLHLPLSANAVTFPLATAISAVAAVP
jgi:hypothetical protein